MKLTINKNQLNTSPDQFLRSAGYGHIHDRHSGHDSYVRRLGSYHYPRLHMYAGEQGDNIVFNLHMDQKQASYAGAHMHNAEYDGSIVADEIARLKSILGPSSDQRRTNGTQSSQSAPAAPRPIPKAGDDEWMKVAPVAEKSWWQKLLGV